MSNVYLKRRKKTFIVEKIVFLMSVVTSLGSLIHNLPQTQRREVRDLEKVSIKICKQKCSLLFNSTCLNENLLPRYSDIKLHDKAARKEAFTLKYRRKLV